jgi:D-alanyl-D-alanine dipeptidase/L,D-peptidoglycan transpeptidase YkuD (ErfK/YbiS/YcfS/YnhG family)
MNLRFAKKFFCSLIISAAIFSAASSGAAAVYPAGFVRVSDLIPDMEEDIRYAGENNFVGEAIDGYEAPEAILTIEAAVALKRAADELRERGFVIKIFDAYRPARAVARFVRWGKNLRDLKMKEIFYPDKDKSVLFKEGYISGKSRHSGGSTVDLTLADRETGVEIDMGSPFDFFGEISRPGSKLVTPEQSANRKILRDAMIAAGFKPVSTEWWHFTLENEPYPKKTFDFPVDFPAKADEKTAAALTRAAGGANRVITAIRADAKKPAAAFVTAYEKSGPGWTVCFSTNGFFGAAGVSSDKKEGDKTTPAGVFTLGIAFGAADDPGANIPYVKITDLDVWVDDPDSKYYNEMMTADVPDADWKSAEALSAFPEEYKYAASINYNTAPAVPGKGSAIFLHCSSGKPTAGCVSVPEPAMIYFLSFIDVDTKIVIANQF